MALNVCAIDIDDGRLAHAKRLGADLVVNAKTADPAPIVHKETGGGAHGVLIAAPSLGAFRQGVAMTRSWTACNTATCRRASCSNSRAVVLEFASN